MSLKSIERCICLHCGGRKFSTTAHVMQEWIVDECGNFEDVSDSCIQVDAGPDPDNFWDCTVCGNEGTFLREIDISEINISTVGFVRDKNSKYFGQYGSIDSIKDDSCILKLTEKDTVTTIPFDINQVLLINIAKKDLDLLTKNANVVKSIIDAFS